MVWLKKPLRRRPALEVSTTNSRREGMKRKIIKVRRFEMNILKMKYFRYLTNLSLDMVLKYSIKENNSKKRTTLVAADLRFPSPPITHAYMNDIIKKMDKGLSFILPLNKKQKKVNNIIKSLGLNPFNLICEKPAIEKSKIKDKWIMSIFLIMSGELLNLSKLTCSNFLNICFYDFCRITGSNAIHRDVFGYYRVCGNNGIITN